MILQVLVLLPVYTLMLWANLPVPGVSYPGHVMQITFINTFVWSFAVPATSAALCYVGTVSKTTLQWVAFYSCINTYLTVAVAPALLRDPSSIGGYRLGDVVAGKLSRGPSTTVGYWGMRTAYTLAYPDSIASAYIKETVDPWQIDVVSRLLDTRNASRQHNAAVVHLRLGDGIVAGYAKNVSYYKAAYRRLARLKGNISTITLVGDFRHTTSHTDAKEKSMRYRDTIERLTIDLFRGSDTAVRHRWEHEPDDDFAFMSSADYFCKAGGGFSQLIADVVRARGQVLFC